MRTAENWVGMFAVSRAGHDRNNIYIIIEETERDVLLADGVLRGMAHPKRKSKKHIQIIKKNDYPEIREKLRSAANTVRDEEIKRAIKQYQNGNAESAGSQDKKGAGKENVKV